MIIKIVLFLTTTIHLFSNTNEFISLYLNNGIEGVQKKIDIILQEQQYWDSYLKDYNVTFGFYGNTQKDLIISNKQNQDLTHYLYDSGNIKKINSFTAIFGKKGGDKQKEGDMKTPIGVYTIIKSLSTRELDPYYGPVAFVTSYPNTLDGINDKNGHGIWIHGFPTNGQKRDDKTKGCIALENEDLLKLNNQISYENSLVITNENSYTITNKDEIATLLATLYKWKYAWENSDLESYLSFYNSDFRRSDKISFEIFSKVKKSIFEKSGKKSIILNDIEVTPYPNIEGVKLFKIEFFEKYTSDIHNFNGKKELFVLLEDNQFKIIAEK